MKKLYVFLLLAVCTVCSKNAFASHISGGELGYTWISDSTYLITFKFYRDCIGISAPTTIQLCYTNSCDAITRTKALTPPALIYGNQPNGVGIVMTCPNNATVCNGGTVPGYQEWWYQDTVTLPYRCTQWTFSVTLTARNIDDNLLNPMYESFYVEATLNNILAPTNTSAVFTVKPLPFIGVNVKTIYNPGAFDINNDSLGFQMIQPMTSAGCSNGTGIPFSSSSFNLVNNPLPTNNTFSLDPIGGTMIFTPSLIGIYTTAMKVTEYRNHVAIGSVMRDVTTTASSIGTSASALKMDSSGLSFTNSRIQDCIGTPLNFCFSVKSQDTSAKLITIDNHLISLPGATITYTGLRSDSVHCCVSWTPTASDYGTRILAISFLDSNCSTASGVQTATYGLLVDIKGIGTIPDTTICYGDSIALPAVGGTTYSWSVLPGGSPLSSLSCTSCASPIAAPTTTTSYVVSSSVSGCSNTDTVKVTVLPVIPTPTITLTGATLSTANSSAYTYQWYRNDTAISGATSYSYTATRDGSYTVRITNIAGCSKTSAPLVVTLGINNIPAGKNIDIYPNPATTAIYVDAPVSVNLEITNIAGTIVLQAQHTKQVDIHNLPSGVYIIKAYDSNGQVLKIAKVVKLGY